MMKRNRRNWLLTPLLLGLFSCQGHSPEGDLSTHRDAVFEELARIRSDRVREARRFLEEQEGRTQELSRRPEVEAAFTTTLTHFVEGSYGSTGFRKIERWWTELFARELGLFYDLLLVDLDGNVFFTLKRETDYLSNVLDPNFFAPGLRSVISNRPTAVRFVDFEFYLPSDEPASFFVAPVGGSEGISGFLVLQLPLTVINRVFVESFSTGPTVEVYLVNERGTMLTESRFVRHGGSLGLQIRTEAARSAIGGQSGEAIIRDYRGRRVYSSYESFEFGGARWAVIAERDESDVQTEYYLRHEGALFPRLLAELQAVTLPTVSEAVRVGAEPAGTRVDLQEYQRDSLGDRLFTHGISTCTGITAHVPGRFGYLLHATPTDAIYSHSWATTRALGWQNTDLLGDVLHRILRTEVLQVERSSVRFGVFATTPQGIREAVRKLTRADVELRQINVVYQPRFATVSVRLDQVEDLIETWWTVEGGGEVVPSRGPYSDLESVLSRVLQGRNHPSEPGRDTRTSSVLHGTSFIDPLPANRGRFQPSINPGRFTEHGEGGRGGGGMERRGGVP